MSTPTDSPLPLRQLKVIRSDPMTRKIAFHATPDAVKTLRGRGIGRLLGDPDAGAYLLVVNEIYDFAAVVAWLEALEEA